jgi:hypothetical protein
MAKCNVFYGLAGKFLDMALGGTGFVKTQKGKQRERSRIWGWGFAASFFL